MLLFVKLCNDCEKSSEIFTRFIQYSFSYFSEGAVAQPLEHSLTDPKLTNPKFDLSFYEVTVVVPLCKTLILHFLNNNKITRTG